MTKKIVNIIKHKKDFLHEDHETHEGRNKIIKIDSFRIIYL